MKAVIMAGGYGMRLRPLTNRHPKAMMPVLNQPVLAHILNLLKRHHICEVVIVGHYLIDQIRNCFGNGSRWGVSICYALEKAPLGTAGCVKHVQPYLDAGPFLVISCDLVTDLDLTKLVRFHRQKEALVTLALTRKAEPFSYGVAVTDSSGWITDYVEKPAPEQVAADTVNTGIYVLEPEVLDFIRPQAAVDFSYHVFPHLLRREAPLFGYVSEDYWSDIGTIEGYRQAISDVLAGKVTCIARGRHLGGQVWAGGNVRLSPDVSLHGPVYLGCNVLVNSGAGITGPTAVSDCTVVGRGARVEQSIIGRDCQLGEQVRVERSIIADHACLPAGAMISDRLLLAQHEQEATFGDRSPILEALSLS